MPTYEYVCTKCGERIEIRATIAEKTKGLSVTCPKCGSSEVSQVFGALGIRTSSSGGSCSPGGFS